MRISIIIPCLNEAEHIESTLTCLEAVRRQNHEVIVVDGGSQDATVALASGRADMVIQSSPGRAQQMNVGASHASGNVLWFIHADTHVPEQAAQQIIKALGNRHIHWGRFDVQLSGEHFILRIIEKMMNLRSRLTGIATGDQGIFIRRASFESIGGFRQIPKSAGV